MKCTNPNCGHEIPDDSKFCPDCGVEVQNTIEISHLDNNHNVKVEDEISTNSELSFLFRVSKLYEISNMGTAAVGQVIVGSVKIQTDIVAIFNDGQKLYNSIQAIEFNRALVDQVQVGDCCGLLLPNIHKNEIDGLIYIIKKEDEDVFLEEVKKHNLLNNYM